MSLDLIRLTRLPAVRPASGAVGELIGAFESDTTAVFLRTAPANEHITLYVLAAMLVVTVALAAVVKLDRVVTEFMSLTGPRKFSTASASIIKN